MNNHDVVNDNNYLFIILFAIYYIQTRMYVNYFSSNLTVFLSEVFIFDDYSTS